MTLDFDSITLDHTRIFNRVERLRVKQEAQLAFEARDLAVTSSKVGHAVKVLRVHKEIPSHAFADMLKISTSYLSNLEAGRNTWSPSLIMQARAILTPKKKDN